MRVVLFVHRHNIYMPENGPSTTYFSHDNVPGGVFSVRFRYWTIVENVWRLNSAERTRNGGRSISNWIPSNYHKRPAWHRYIVHTAAYDNNQRRYVLLSPSSVKRYVVVTLVVVYIYIRIYVYNTVFGYRLIVCRTNGERSKSKTSNELNVSQQAQCRKRTRANENGVIVARPEDTCELPIISVALNKKIEFNPREQQTSFINAFRNFYQIDYNKTRRGKNVVRFVIDYNNCVCLLVLSFWNFF